MYPASQGAEAALLMRSEAEGAAEPSLSAPLNGPNPAAAGWRLDAATLQPVPRRGRGSCLAWVGAAGRLATGATTTLESLFSHPLDPCLAPKTTTAASSPMAGRVQVGWPSREPAAAAWVRLVSRWYRLAILSLFDRFADGPNWRQIR
jgi:hypothetical protein